MESLRVRSDNSKNTSNNQDNIKTKSHVFNLVLIEITCDPKRIVSNTASPSFLVTFRQAKLRNKAIQNLEERMEATLESDTRGAPLKLTTGQDHTPVLMPSISYKSIAPELRNAMQKIASEEPKRIFAVQADPSIQKATEKAPSDIFFFAFKKASSGSNERIALLHWKRPYGNGMEESLGRHVKR